jgi:hypothetical protein
VLLCPCLYAGSLRGLLVLLLCLLRLLGADRVVVVAAV